MVCCRGSVTLFDKRTSALTYKPLLHTPAVSKYRETEIGKSSVLPRYPHKRPNHPNLGARILYKIFASGGWWMTCTPHTAQYNGFALVIAFCWHLVLYHREYRTEETYVVICRASAKVL